MFKKILRLLSFGWLLIVVTACSVLAKEGQEGQEITISNQSGVEICEVFISPESSDGWGENLLADPEELPAGSQRTFTLKSGTYDLLVRSCGQAAVFSSSDIQGDFTALIGGTDRLALRAINRTQVEVCFVYIVPAGAGGWGEDQLGLVEGLLPAGSRLFFIEAGVYNLRAEDCDHNLISQQDNFDPAGGLDWEIGP